MGKIAVLHGINLQTLGRREPDIYGRVTLEAINSRLRRMGREAGVEVDCRQTNCEGEMAGWIAELDPDDFLIINPGAWTHTHYSIPDAIRAAGTPALEVHLSNIGARESFRARSVVAPACLGQICGLGAGSYYLAMNYALERMTGRAPGRTAEGVEEDE
ncbi:MAG: 3-dehydroquinate dehydratase [Gracilibacteraceae bacterium]|jgi:3-dehydroquinate dehydratase-2|nr:3-dehydroquinate dehydratase [Gracilibacteraceae bacterium]